MSDHEKKSLIEKNVVTLVTEAEEPLEQSCYD